MVAGLIPAAAKREIDKAMALSKRFPEIEKKGKVRGTEMAERYFDQQKIECAILEKKK